MTKDKNKTMSKKMKRAIAILIIVIVAVSSFQLYEKVSEPKNQINLCKNMGLIKQCLYRPFTHPEIYRLNYSSFHANIYIASLPGFGHKSNFGKGDLFYDGAPSMGIVMDSCHIDSPFSSLSFQITNVMEKYVNETYGNATSIHYSVSSRCAHISNSTKFRRVSFCAYTSWGNHLIKYPGIGEYANFNLTHEVNYTLYDAVTIVPLLHYNYLLSGYVTGKPITLVYDPNVTYCTLGPKDTFPVV